MPASITCDYCTNEIPLGEAKDLRTLENTTIESVTQELERERNFTWALDLTLIALDLELEDDIRAEALAGLEELFGDSKVIEQVENVFYAEPLPKDADLTKAKELCNPKLQAVRDFLARLEEHQSAITSVVEAWEAIPVTKFPTTENKKHFRQVAAKEGLCRALATLDSSASISTFLLKALNSSIQQLPNYRQIIHEWTKPFRQSRETRELEIDNDED